MLDRLTIIETKIDDYNKIKDKTEEAYTLSRENEKEIEEIKGKMSWLSKAIGAALLGLIVEVIVFVIKMM